jgi:hypothetical protein
MTALETAVREEPRNLVVTGPRTSPGRKWSSAIQARRSIGIGASGRDHEQYGRCTRELL